MSGTSLDGLDIAYCTFRINNENHKASPLWVFKIHQAETIPYRRYWRTKLMAAYQLKPGHTLKVDRAYGRYLALKVKAFIKKYKIVPDFISSHGHTILHEPARGITVQIGSGEVIRDLCHIPVVCNFRSGDVRLGGQGAPLVPVADKYLFGDYDYCLNLGGFANLSYDDRRKRRIAFDICPVNIVLNKLAERNGKSFDKGGKIAAKGFVDQKLLKQLNNLRYYHLSPPKSLGREWVEKNLDPLFSSSDLSVESLSRTLVEHIAIQIASTLNRGTKHSKVLVTGGGAYHHFLIERIRQHTGAVILLPGKKIIQYKEAMAFAFLGVLRMRNEVNILKSVTGAAIDSSGGKIYR